MGVRNMFDSPFFLSILLLLRLNLSLSSSICVSSSSLLKWSSGEMKLAYCKVILCDNLWLSVRLNRMTHFCFCFHCVFVLHYLDVRCNWCSPFKLHSKKKHVFSIFHFVSMLLCWSSFFLNLLLTIRNFLILHLQRQFKENRCIFFST